MATYTYSLSIDFSNQICLSTLTAEIEAEGAITTGLAHISVGLSASADNVDIVFDSALSGSEQTALDGVVAAHDGSVCPPTGEPFMPRDGSLAFTAPVSGEDPTLGSHLATQTTTEESSANALTQSMEYTDTLVATTSGNVGALLGLGEWKYDTSTTPPPTDKKYSFNNANPESATKIYIDYTNDSGDDVSNILSNVSGNNTILYFQNRRDATDAFFIRASGFTDQTTYGEFDIADIELFGGTLSTTRKYSLIVGNIGGGGDVVGPDGATDNTFAIFDGATGKLISEASGFKLEDNGTLSLVVSTGNGIPAIYVTQQGTSGEFFMFENAIGNVIMELRQGTAGEAIWRFFHENGETLLFQLEDGDISFGQPVSGSTPTEDYHLATKAYADGVGGGGVFGSEFQQESSEGESSTTSSSYQQKLRLTTGSLPSGVYRIGWYAEIDGQTDPMDMRVELNDTDEIGYNDYDSSLSDYINCAGFYYDTLSGVNTIDIDWRELGGTGLIRRARLEIWRIS